MTGDIRTLQACADLWAALRDMRIEEPGATRSFALALAVENGRTLEWARAVEIEYRRFLYLAATHGPNVTPSADVDRAWHLHLTYTRHYWDVLCGEILRRPLHHVPSSGSDEDDARYSRQYDETLVAYERAFGEPPPPHIWPRAGAEADSWTEDAESDPLIRREDVPRLAGAAALMGVGALAGGPVGFLIALLIAASTLHLLGFGSPRRAATQKQEKEKGYCGSGGGCGIGGTRSGDEACADASCGGGGCGGD